MRRLSFLWMVAVCVGPLCVAEVPHAGAEEAHRHGEEARGSSPVNPLIEEMRTLDVTFREVVSAVSLGDGQRILKALEAMHGTKERTHEGIHAGHVRIPRNADLLEEFVRLDEEFHHVLEDLAGAARQGNSGKMVEFTKDLLDRCVGCHQAFRE